MVRTLAYGTESVDYEIRFSTGRRTLTIEVHPDGCVLVRAPEGCAERVIEQRVRRRAAWVYRQLDAFKQYRPRTPQRQHIAGETHLYLGRQYRLKLQTDPSLGVVLSRGQLLVRTPAPPDPWRIKTMLHDWYLERARRVFGEVLDASLQKHFRGVRRPRLGVRPMRTRWGSLSAAGTMTLNLDLVKAPRPCIEYVVCHELCHTRHRDHGQQFYRMLDRVMPDWQMRKRRLEMVLL